MPVPEPPITIAAARHGGPQTVVNRVVIHDEEYPVSNHSAEDVANYFARPSTLYQAHYVVDADSTQHCVPENTVAFHAPPNLGSVGIEQDGYARFTPEEWQQPGSQATIRRCAGLAAEICDRWAVPKEWLSVADLEAGRRGITSHANVSLAFGISTHTDPGPSYPIEQFMTLVLAHGAPEEPEEPEMIYSQPLGGVAFVRVTDQQLDEFAVLGDRLVQRFTRDGANWTDWTQPAGTEAGQLTGPVSVSVDPKTNVYEIAGVGVDGRRYGNRYSGTGSTWDGWRALSPDPPTP